MRTQFLPIRVEKNMVLLFRSLLLVNLALFSGCKKDDAQPTTTTTTSTLSDQDKSFMTNATLSNNAEIMLGALAASKGTADSVKIFGHMMVNDHTTMGTQMKTLAAAKSVTLPADTTLDAQHKTLYNKLSGMSAGYKWDSTYMVSQIMDHTTASALFQQEISSGMDADVKKLATDGKPKIDMHLQMANSISTAHGFK